MISKMAEYFMNNGSAYLSAIGGHLWISFLSVLLAVVIALPLGVLAASNERAYKIVTTVFNTIRIIPSLAVLILLIPIMGTGIRPTVTALVFLAIPPVLINTALAFHSVPESMLEAAKGLGMSEYEVFFDVQLPLSVPFIFTGLRTAVVEVISSATLAAYIGGGGLGTIIFTGLSLNRKDLLLIGGISVAVMAASASSILNILKRRLLKYQYP